MTCTMRSVRVDQWSVAQPPCRPGVRCSHPRTCGIWSPTSVNSPRHRNPPLEGPRAHSRTETGSGMAAKTPARSRDNSRPTSSFLEVLESLALTGTAVPTMPAWEQTRPADAARRWQAPASQALLPVQMLVVWGTRAAEVGCVATAHHLELIVMRTQRPGASCTRVLWDQGFVHRENGSLALRAHRSTPSGGCHGVPHATIAVAPAWPWHGFCSAASPGTRAGG